MKKLHKWSFLAVFFLVSPGLSAQIPNDAEFFVLPVTGAGTREAKSFLYDRIVYEVAFQDRIINWARRGSDYVIRGTIHSVIEDRRSANDIMNTRGATPRIRNTGDRREFLSWEVRDTALFYDTSSNRNSTTYTPEFVLVLRLIESRTNDIIDERHLVFNDLNDEVRQGISSIMSDFFMRRRPVAPEVDIIPAIIAERGQGSAPRPAQSEPEAEMEPEEQTRLGFSDDWRDKLFFFEATILWSPRENKADNNISFINFGVNFSFEFHLLNFFALEAGVQFIQETTGGTGIRVQDLALEFPAAVKIVFKPLNNFMFEIYGGLSYNCLAVMKRFTPSTFSYIGGAEVCIKTWLGTFVLDARFALDTNYSTFDSGLRHQRRMLQFGIGYKTGFIPRLVRKPI